MPARRLVQVISLVRDYPIPKLEFQWDNHCIQHCFNATGHPALGLSCGMLLPIETDILTEADRNIRLPVAFKIVGKCFDKVRMYRAAVAWEKLTIGRTCRKLSQPIKNHLDFLSENLRFNNILRLLVFRL
jgi:hypothetical protein